MKGIYADYSTDELLEVMDDTGVGYALIHEAAMRIRELKRQRDDLLEACKSLKSLVVKMTTRPDLGITQSEVGFRIDEAQGAIEDAEGPKTNDVDVDPATDDDSIQERIEIDDDFAEEVEHDRNNEPEP